MLELVQDIEAALRRGLVLFIKTLGFMWELFRHSLRNFGRHHEYVQREVDRMQEVERTRLQIRVQLLNARIDALGPSPYDFGMSAEELYNRAMTRRVLFDQLQEARRELEKLV